MAPSVVVACSPTRAPSLDPTAPRVQALASGSAARPVDVPEARHGRGQLQVAAEAFEARLVCEPLLHAVDELVDRRVARVAQLEAAALTALLAAHVDTHRPESATGAIWREPSRSEEHTSELQSRFDHVCRLLPEKKTRSAPSG